MTSRRDRAVALVTIILMLSCWAGFVLAVIEQQYALAFGLAFASLAPALLAEALYSGGAA